jgi:hypothetical protein
MSEPDGGGGHQPNPDPDKDQQDKQDTEKQESWDESQDQGSEHVYNDPTAPVWVDPTTPIPSRPPVPPTPPGGAHTESGQSAGSPYGQQAPGPTSPPPISNPYAQRPPVQPYGQQPPVQPYGQQQPGGQQYAPYAQQTGQQAAQQYLAYGQQPYATGPRTESNGSAIGLTITSAIIMLSTCFTIGVPSLIFGIMALTSNSSDPAGSRKQAKTGWIVFAVNAAVIVLVGIIGGILLAVNSGSGGASSPGSSF